MKLQRYNLGELTKHYASDKDNVVCRAYDVDKLEASHAELKSKCAELLEAATNVLKWWDGGNKISPKASGVIDRLRAAIANAERASE